MAATTTTIAATTTTIARSFGLAVDTSTVQIANGGSATLTVGINRIGGYDAAVPLTLANLPIGVSYVFSPNPVAGSTSVLTLLASGAATSTSTVSVVSGVATASFTLVVVSSTTNTSGSLSVSPATQTVAPGSAATYALSIVTTSALTTAATFSATGIPSGATVAFNPATSTTATAATITTTAATPIGTYPVTFTAANGTITVSVTASLVVGQTGAAFELVPTPVSASVALGGTATYTIGVTTSGGAAAPITFTVSGLPAGATPTFSANPSAIGTTLYVAVSNVAPGAYSFTVTGTTGLITRSTVLSLTVT